MKEMLSFYSKLLFQYFDWAQILCFFYNWFNISSAVEMPKAEKKKQEKIIEDKTFGLKNKNKSKAVQK